MLLRILSVNKVEVEVEVETLSNLDIDPWDFSQFVLFEQGRRVLEGKTNKLTNI